MELFTIGYGRWAAESRSQKLLSALREAGVEVLVDIRHSPCSSNLDPRHQYGPRDWHLRAEGAGIARLLQAGAIEYRWLGELGNPQKNDPEMRVLREHLNDRLGAWPVHRGLAELRKLVVDAHKICCLMCVCADLGRCHRKVVAEAFQKHLAPMVLLIRDLSTSERLP